MNMPGSIRREGVEARRSIFIQAGALFPVCNTEQPARLRRLTTPDTGPSPAVRQRLGMQFPRFVQHSAGSCLAYLERQSYGGAARSNFYE
jgi:hypothetical protein